MITRQELLSNRELLADKTQGALSGLAIGDSFGDAARTPDNQRDRSEEHTSELQSL